MWWSASKIRSHLRYPVHSLTEPTMGFAIIASGGKQYRVQPGDIIEVERLDGVESGPLTLRDILMVEDCLLYTSPSPRDLEQWPMAARA